MRQASAWGIPTVGKARSIMLTAAAIWIGAAVAIPYIMLRPKRSAVMIGPAMTGIPLETVTFRSADGVRLRGWLIKPTQARPRGVVVLCHGIDGTREMMLGTAKTLQREGFACLLFDFRARGESGGDRCTLGVRETADAGAAIDFVLGRADLASLPIVMAGKSEGAAVAILTAAQRPEVRAVIAESAFSRLDRAIENHFRAVLGPFHWLLSGPVRAAGEPLIGGPAMSVSPEAAIAQLRDRPVLLIQDANDRLCPASEGARLMRASGGRLVLWTVPGAGHVGAEQVAPGEYERKIVVFLNAAIPRQAAITAARSLR